MSQPAVAPIVNYLQSLTPKVNPNCDPGHNYVLNNYNPGYFGDGTDAYTDANPSTHRSPFPARRSTASATSC
jgi:phospholipase C